MFVRKRSQSEDKDYPDLFLWWFEIYEPIGKELEELEIGILGQ